MAVLEEGGTPEAAERAAMCAISAKDDAALEQMQHEAPETYAQLVQTAALFPSAMEDSELGEIPEGWSYGKLKDIAAYPNERVPTAALSLHNYISTENMLEGKRGISVGNPKETPT